jgi:hypothetical protein
MTAGDEFVLDDSVVRVEDDELAGTSPGSRKVSYPPGVINRFAGDRQPDLPGSSPGAVALMIRGSESFSTVSASRPLISSTS